MIWRTSTLPWVLLTWSQYTAAQQTWPSVTDELEDILFLTSGYRSRHFADGVTPCSASPGGVAGRNAAAEWIRTAFHDMAPGNAFQGVGGLDASLMFEADRGENIGSAFTTTLTTYAPFLSSRLSMADIISAGVYSATRSCGGPVIPVRGGRVDATAPGASGVPLPNDGTAVFTSRFNRMGYNRSEMIAFVACGHSLGGVHSSDFPDIVPAGTAPNDYATLDSTVAVFDNKIVTEYFAGTSKNPLIVGPSVKLKKNADTMVYTADGNATMKTLTNAATFSARCRDMFQKMIETVPAGVTLTDPVKPYEVKPYDVQLTLLDGGSQLAFTGEIRIRTTNRGTGSIGKVQLVYKNRTGATATTPIDTTYKGDASGFDDTFSFYSFSTKLPSDSSISSFNVLITNTPGASETQSNGGNGFKVDDTVIYQAPQSCQASGNLTVVAAVRSGTSSPTLRVVVKNPVAGVVVPSLSTTNIPMVTQSTVGAYQLYSASYSGSQAASFGVYSGSSSDNYKNASSLPSACSSLTAPSSTPIPTPTPSSAPFTFQGCYLDNGNPRALDWVGQADDGMTVEKCATFCSSFQLFGLEYGRECYCSNKLASYSTLMGLSDCNMACAGNSTQMCGSGSRLSLYKNNKYSPPVTPSISGYNYLGCYSEATNGRALTDTATTSDKMTVETCATFCGGSSYFGIEYSSECYCGSALQAGSTIQSSDDCNMVCGGNSTEFCGAGNRLNIYQQKAVPSSSSTSASATIIVVPSTSTVVITSTVVPSSSTITSSLPVSSSSSLISSAVVSSSSAIISSTSTPQETSSTFQPILSDSSSSVTATPSLNSAVPPSTFTDTNATTTDNSNSTIIVTVTPIITHTINSTFTTSDSTATSTIMSTLSSSPTPVSSSSSFASPSPSSTFTPPSFPDYNYTGCLVDSVVNRTLGALKLQGDTVNYTVCAQFCAQYIYFGVEYGRECYCGDHLVKNITAPGGEADCNVPCRGDNSSTTMCGAADRLNVFKSTTLFKSPGNPIVVGYNYTGCHTDSVQDRVLKMNHMNDANMTVAKCAGFCGGSEYFGTQYGTECYCGEEFANPSQVVDEGDCSFACGGNSEEYCGAGDRLSMWQRVDN